MATPSSTVVRPWGLTVSGLALIAVCYGLARFAYGLFLPAFKDAFHFGGTLSGVIAGGSFAAYCVTVVAAAAAVTRFGPRPVAAAAGLTAAAGMALVAAATDAGMLAVGVLIAGASTGVASPPLAEAIGRWGPRHHHDRAQAIVNAGPAAGIVASGFVALSALGHWRIAWAAFAVTAVVVTCWVTLLLPARGASGADTDAVRPLGALAAVARDRRSWPALGAAALFGAASSATWSFGREHVMDAGGASTTVSVLLWVVLGAAELVGLSAGDLIERHGLRRVWTVALALLGTASAVIGLLPGLPVAAFAGIAVFGAGYVTLTTVIFFWITRMHPGTTAAAVALGFLMISAGQAVASPAVGALADRMGTAFAFLACAALGVLGAGAVRPRTRS
ncbi:MFS transporter [Streptomyces sp. NPDC049967]|uniref:MFS transporter n=1 Tax=unclassified Streptomyces TaxID=2593676 RepID=UPI002E2BC286|nr:MFS transporter [Streptomyces sp. NBC_00342]